ncbi:polymorphic toxin-type HINT domain-containing protein [Kitasatospora sp. NPDC097643]|uniref:polymorphic toxin-type HINT domain-containing protein n=1 Tax=Kitasatospora sp. NPDC097643 TaxID=3157230 RepID=UPI00332E55C1
MADGSTKPIGDIKVGDRVESADQGTATDQGGRTVIAQLVHDDEDLINLEVTADGVSSTIKTTSNHPFWDETDHAWVPASKLIAGHALKTDTDERILVAAVNSVRGHAQMYNLTVAQLHTYYVIAGATPVLVHNECIKFENRYGATDNRGLFATFEDEMMEMTLRARMPDGTRYAGAPSGADMFKEALEAFGGPDKIRGITASWNVGELDTNLRKFNELIRKGESLEDAARGTWTGRQAGARGWTSASVDLEMSSGIPTEHSKR